MADHTFIEWTEATWNPVTGCSVLSPGCKFCYAMKMAGTRLKHHPSRAGLTTETKAGPVWNGTVRLNEQWLDQPLRWKRGRMIFVCAHGDLFHEDVPDEWIDRVFAVMALSPQHTFQVLTKRSARMRAYLSVDPDVLRDRWFRAVPAGKWFVSVSEAYAGLHPHASDEMRALYHRHALTWPLPNVWLGVSAERKREASERVPDLLETPAAIRFVSAEPLLGPINFRSIDVDGYYEVLPLGAGWLDRLEEGETEGPRLDWIIVGGESGPDARPMHPDWARTIRDQCAAAGVPFFFKQWGTWAIASEANGHSDSSMVSNDAVWLHLDGLQTKPSWHRDDVPLDEPLNPVGMFRMGKKAAGRLLDGVEHNGMPSQ